MPGVTCRQTGLANLRSVPYGLMCRGPCHSFQVRPAGVNKGHRRFGAFCFAKGAVMESGVMSLRLARWAVLLVAAACLVALLGPGSVVAGDTPRPAGTWTLLSSWPQSVFGERDADLESVAFSDAAHGWMYGHDRSLHSWPTTLVLRTVDGGTTWREQDVPAWELAGADPRFDPESGPTDLSAPVAREAWLVTSWHIPYNALADHLHVGTFFRTTDGGDRWERVAFNGQPVTDPAAGRVDLYGGLVHVEFPTPGEGWVLGWQMYHGDRPWAGETKGSGNADYRPRTVVFRTRDGGRHWLKYEVARDLRPDRMYLQVIDADRAQVALVEDPTSALARTAILQTSDGGRTWTGAEVPLAARDVAFFDADAGLIVAERRGVSGSGVERVLLVTADGGRTWSEAWLGRADLGVPRVMSKRLGLVRIIGGDEWLVTTDGGRSWSVRQLDAPSPDPEELGHWASPPMFMSPTSGWLVGGHSIWRYGLGAKTPTIDLLD